MLEKYNETNTYEILIKHRAILITYNKIAELSAKEATDLFEVLFYYKTLCMVDIVSEEGKYVFCTFNNVHKRRVVFYFQYSKRKLNMKDVENYKKNELINYNYRSKDCYYWFSNMGFTDEADTRTRKIKITAVNPIFLNLVFNCVFNDFKKRVKEWNEKCRKEREQLEYEKRIAEINRRSKEIAAQHERNKKKSDEDLPWELEMDIFDDLMDD